jgi:hypothetical protein
VRVWTAHETPHAAPILIREGFSYGAFFFGPIWLLARGAWLAALVLLAVALAILLFAPRPMAFVLGFGLALLQGFSGRDLIRWTVTRRGYLETNVVTGPNEDAALARLYEARADLMEREMVAETAP